MPSLLLELFSEEIPARMQAKAAADLQKRVTDALVARGCLYEGAVAYVTPRRLTLQVVGLPAMQAETREEKKGPRVGAPQQAIDGFLKSAGFASLDQAKIISDPKKGDFYIAEIIKAGAPLKDVLAEIIPEIIRSFAWPKSMRWGSGSMRWVRPLHSILCTFGDEIEEAEVVAFEVEGIKSGDTTRGHRFMSSGEIKARRFEDYEAKLKKAKVILRQDKRREEILNQAKARCALDGLSLIEDNALLDEVTGLVEWPVVLMGGFEKRFLALPEEVIRTTIRQNQKCFVVRGADGMLAPHFLLTANIEASDHGKAIIAGNERVIRARLSDALFFYEQDMKVKLEERLEKLKGITFHEKIGTQYERVERIVALAAHIAPLVGADVESTRRAARLAKADLVTEMVGEFPELQGLMGKTYHAAQCPDEPAAIAAAIEEHYKPLGPKDSLPTTPVSIAVALADKLDMLTSFWAIDEKPTGSKDPFALRRAALGVLRILIEKGIAADLKALIASSGRLNAVQTEDLYAFMMDRLKGQLIEQGVRYDVVEAVFAVNQTQDLPSLIANINNCVQVMGQQRGVALVAAFNRANNILNAEEKKAALVFTLFENIGKSGNAYEDSLKHNIAQAHIHWPKNESHSQIGFANAYNELGNLTPILQEFFDNVLINAEDPQTRANRLGLLQEFRRLCLLVADFSKIVS